MMRFFLLVLLVWPLAAFAQSDDRGFIQGLLEDALSDSGRDVRIEGFAGALSSRATIDRITVADDEGTWLTVTDVAMTWTRSALLSGEVEIDEITVGRIEMPRLPVPLTSDTPPSPEARSPFALPELPVSFKLANLNLQEVALGAPVATEDMVLQVTGSASLAGGEGEADLQVQRLDAGGQLRLSGAYNNETRNLRIDTQFEEPAGGVAARVLGLQGRPSVSLSLTGNGPIDDFAANLQLSTEGIERLAGEVILRADADADAGTQRLSLDVGGDLAPILAPDYRAFLGESIQLTADAVRHADGSLVLENLDLRADALELSGTAALAGDGWPEHLQLSGQIVPAAGNDVLLPVPGSEIRVARATLAGSFDASEGNGWQIDFDTRGLMIAGTAFAERLELSGAGEIDRAASRVTGALDLSALGLRPVDTAVAEAVGDRLRGALRFDWQPDAPLVVREMDLSGEDYGVTGGVTIDGSDVLNPRIAPDLRLRADDLSRFATLAGVDLRGAAQLAISGELTPVTGGFDLTLDGMTQDLATGIAQLDPLIAGEGSLRVEAVRDEDGLRAEELLLITPEARIEGGGTLATGASQLRAEARIRETGLVLPDLSGPTELTVRADQSGDVWSLEANGTVAEAGQLTYAGTVDLGGEVPQVAGRLTAALSRLSAFSDLVGRQLSGGLNIDVTGEGRLDGAAFSVSADGQVQDLQLSLPDLDPLLRGRTDFTLAATRESNGPILFDPLVLEGVVDARFTGTVDPDGPGGPKVDGTLTAEAGTLAPFAGLAGMPLRGAAQIEAQASGSILDGPLTLSATVQGQDVGLGRPDIDPLLRGRTELTLNAERSADGVIRFDPLVLDGVVDARFTGTVSPDAEGGPQVDGTLTAETGSLAPFAGLAGMPLRGAAQIEAQASGGILNGPLSLSATVRGQGLGIGMPTVDPLLRGDSRLEVSIARLEDQGYRIDDLTLDASGIDAQVSGRYGLGGEADLALEVQLPNLGAIVSELPGAARVSGTARRSGGPWQLALDGSGPAGIGATVNGTAAQDFSRVDLNLNGSAPLSLANGVIAPQVVSGILNFDLAMNGAPGLSALSGVVSTDGARFAAPTQNIVVNDLGGQARLSGGQAQISMSGSLASGGRVEVSGPVTLSPPFRGDLVVALRDAVLRQEDLFETTANGRIEIDGPLTGGATIGGAVDLGAVEARIPSIGASYSALDGLKHVAPPRDVQLTLKFAGLDKAQQAGGGGSAVPGFPLNLVVRAENRIFVRGRGLDAELGGTLRLTGTTSDVVPVGQFDLIRGRLDLLGRRLELTEGFVALRGSFDPVIRFVATTRVEDTEITITIAGPASSPELTVGSVPELPQDEALSFFLFGRSVTEISALQAVQLAAAIRTLSGQGGLGLTESLRGGLGVSDLDIGTTADGTVEARVGAYLTDNIYSDVTVDATGETEINLNLTINPEVTVRGRLGSDGSSGIGVFFERDY